MAYLFQKATFTSTEDQPSLPTARPQLLLHLKELTFETPKLAHPLSFFKPVNSNICFIVTRAFSMCTCHLPDLFPVSP